MAMIRTIREILKFKLNDPYQAHPDMFSLSSLVSVTSSFLPAAPDNLLPLMSLRRQSDGRGSFGRPQLTDDNDTHSAQDSSRQRADASDGAYTETGVTLSLV